MSDLTAIQKLKWERKVQVNTTLGDLFCLHSLLLLAQRSLQGVTDKTDWTRLFVSQIETMLLREGMVTEGELRAFHIHEHAYRVRSQSEEN